jgi:hypothetical protein
MRKSFSVTKCTLAILDSIKRVRRVYLALCLTDFGPVAVVTHDFFEKRHDIARHVHHPLQTTIR